MERGLIALLARLSPQRGSEARLGRHAASEMMRMTGPWNTQRTEAESLTDAEVRLLENAVAGAIRTQKPPDGRLVSIQAKSTDQNDRTRTLVVIPCGKRKIWDKDPGHGPAPAKDAYTGAPFTANKAYAERFADAWVILSAKYGFVPPEFTIPGSYDVTFKKKSTNPVSISILQEQIREQRLNTFDKIVGLGGKEYRAVVREAFAPLSVLFPLAGLRQGEAMREINQAIKSGQMYRHD